MKKQNQNFKKVSKLPSRSKIKNGFYNRSFVNSSPDNIDGFNSSINKDMIIKNKKDYLKIPLAQKSKRRRDNIT